MVKFQSANLDLNLGVREKEGSDTASSHAGITALGLSISVSVSASLQEFPADTWPLAWTGLSTIAEMEARERGMVHE